MSTQAALDFLKKSAADQALAGQVAAATGGKKAYEAAAAVAALGKANGCDFTAAEAVEAWKHAVGHLRKEGLLADELSDDALDKVAGGAPPTSGTRTIKPLSGTPTLGAGGSASPTDMVSSLSSMTTVPSPTSNLNVINTIQDPNNPNSANFNDYENAFNVMNNILPR